MYGEQLSSSFILLKTTLTLVSILNVDKLSISSFMEPCSFIFTDQTHKHKPLLTVTFFFEKIHKLHHMIEHEL